MTIEKNAINGCIQSPTPGDCQPIANLIKFARHESHESHGSTCPFKKGLGVHVVVEVVASQEDGLGLLIGGDTPRLAEGLEVALEVVQGALGTVPGGLLGPCRWKGNPFWNSVFL